MRHSSPSQYASLRQVFIEFPFMFANRYKARSTQEAMKKPSPNETVLVHRRGAALSNIAN